MKHIIQIEDLVKKYKTNTVLDKINFSIYRGKFISILGPNGCGKSTLMKIASGLEKPTSGKLHKIKNNKIGFVFQDYKESLLPWRKVFENIKLPLEISKKQNIEEKTTKILKEFNLLTHKDKYPFQLSGGLAQLTAIARAIVNNPELLILDEPFKSLDFDVAEKIIKIVMKYCEKNNITTILVSHDIDQAILFADQIIILSKTPSKVKKIVDIKLSRPRQIEVISSKQFFNTKNKIMEILIK